MHAARARSLNVASATQRASQPSVQRRSHPLPAARHSERLQVVRASSFTLFLRRFSSGHQHGPPCTHHTRQNHEARQSSALQGTIDPQSLTGNPYAASGPKGALTAECYVEKMERAGLPVCASVIGEFIAHACTQGDLPRAMSFFRLLKSRSLAPEKRTVPALVRVMQLAIANNPPDAKEVLAFLQNPPAQPTTPAKPAEFDLADPEFAQLWMLVGGALRLFIFLNPTPEAGHTFLRAYTGKIMFAGLKPLDPPPLFSSDGEPIDYSDRIPQTEEPRTSDRGGGQSGGRASGNEIVSESVGPFGVPWFLWLFPLLAFLLGTWQVYRWDRKQKSKQEREERLKSPAQPLPKDMSAFDLLANSYKTFFVTGKVDNTSFAFVAPRMHDGELGRWLVSAFEEKDTGRRILLNRGWLPKDEEPPAVDAELFVNGRVRGDGARNTFTPANDPAKGSYFSLDVHQLAEALHTEPVLLDVAKRPVPIPPPPGTLPDNHLQYVGTWYTLSAALTAMALRYGKSSVKTTHKRHLT